MEDMIKAIEKKIWTVENFLPRLNEIKDDAKRLLPKERKRIPVYSGDWSQESVRKYLKEIDTAVKDPIRHKNKRKLEEIDVKTEGIPDDVFEDTLGIDEIVKLCEEIKKIDEIINKILISETLLTSWIEEGTNTTREKLEEILDAKPMFKHVFESEIDEKLKFELLKRSIEDVNFLSDAEDIIHKFTYACDYGLIVKYNEDLKSFAKNLNETHSKMQQIEENYGISKEEIKTLIKDKTPQEADELLGKVDEEYAEKKRKSLEEWKMYSSTLKPLGEEILEPPKGIHELESAVENMRDKCLGYLGEPGFRLFRFLKGEDNFPEDVGIKEIKKALEVLRPFFIKSLMEES